MSRPYYYYVNLIFDFKDLTLAQERLGLVQARSHEEAKRRMDQFQREQKKPFRYSIGNRTAIEHIVVAQPAPEVITLI
jgi:hypothetical protein